MAETEDVLHALDLAMAGIGRAARAAIQDAEGHRRTPRDSLARHRVRRGRSNARSKSSGTRSATPSRSPGQHRGTDRRRARGHAGAYAGIYEALRDADYLLDDLRRAPRDRTNSTIVIDTFDICGLLKAQCAAIQGLAEAKDSAFSTTRADVRTTTARIFGATRRASIRSCETC